MKKTGLLLLSGLLFCTSGCASMDAKLEQIMLSKSGIHREENYVQYLSFKDKEQLTADGYHTETERLNEKVIPADWSRVTFADNPHLKTSFYKDSALTDPIDMTNCWLVPGDSVYAAPVKTLNPASDLYGFSGYRIYSYDASGTRTELAQINEDGGLILQIPEDAPAGGYSIIPIGEYHARSVTMGVFYTDDDGKQHTIGNPGSWAIRYGNAQGNGMEHSCNGNTALISPLEEYTVRLNYDQENYFFVSASPSAHDENGTVIFKKASPLDSTQAYSVELHQYLSLSIKLPAGGTVQLNNGTKESIGKNKKYSSGKLRYGDRIVIETNGECVITGGDYRHISAEKDPISDKFRYTLTVEEKAFGAKAELLQQFVSVHREFHIQLGTNGRYGICTYSFEGQDKAIGWYDLPEGTKVTVQYTITAPQYYQFINKGSILDTLFSPDTREATFIVQEKHHNTSINPDNTNEFPTLAIGRK